MNNLMIFKNENFGQVRVLEQNGEPWFVGKDVALILGYNEPRSAVSKKVDIEDRGVAKMETPSGIQNMTIINESGLYSLILSSKLPNAKQFKRWVTSEVLPQIHKTGGYIPITNEDDEKSILIKAVGIYERTIKEKDNFISQLKPKADEYDIYLSCDGTYSVNQAGKILGLGEKVLFQKLRDIKLLYYDNNDSVPYERYIKSGYFTTVGTYDRRGVAHTTTRVTPKGVSYICKKLKLTIKEVA